MKTILDFLTRISHQLSWRGGEGTGLARPATVNKILAVVLDSTSRRQREHNAARTNVFVAGVGGW